MCAYINTNTETNKNTKKYNNITQCTHTHAHTQHLHHNLRILIPHKSMVSQHQSRQERRVQKGIVGEDVTSSSEPW